MTVAALPIQSNGLSDEATGIRQEKKGFKPPSQAQPNMLTKEMAEAAAKKYEKDKKKIQKACAQLDPPGETKAGCCSGCTII
jgi:hypothetical protein